MKVKWEGLWGAGLAPVDLFDARGPSPALLARLGALGRLEGRRVLVPGCGRGYDLSAFVEAGVAETVGLEISPTSRDDVHEYLQEALGAKGLAGRARMELQDFFSDEAFYPKGLGQFDLVYDHTFFCAIDPQLRDAWAHGMGKVLRPGGRLDALIFTIDPVHGRDVGPPFPVTCAVYERLHREGFRTEAIDETSEGESHQGREGIEKSGIFARGGESSTE